MDFSSMPDAAAPAWRPPADLVAPEQTPERSPERERWRSLLRGRLFEQALPLLILEHAVVPAASLWTGARRWTHAFREAGLQAGDRLVLALPPSPAFVQVMVAALWEGLSLAPVPPSTPLDACVAYLDARAAVAATPGPHRWTPDDVDGPQSQPERLRPAEHAATPEVRFLLATSGTTGPARYVALSDRNVLAVLDSHRPLLGVDHGRVLSVLPWTHAFGLVLDLLPALLGGAEIIRDPSGGRDADYLAQALSDHDVTHLSAVPLTVQRLLAHPDGLVRLQALRGGTIGGAPITPDIANALSGSRLRVGYGQTEASPGLALGPPGHIATNYLGLPVGCQTRIDDEGMLHFMGPNAHLGLWDDGGLRRLDPDRWVATRDLVEERADGFYFRGRADDAFKLANGRFVQAGAYEALLKERLPGVQDALIVSADSATLRVGLVLHAEAPLPTPGALRPYLGSLGSLVRDVRVVAPGTWARTPKGSVDRAATAAQLTL